VGISRCSSGVERFLGKEKVRGSIPLIGSKTKTTQNKQLWQKKHLTVPSRT